MTLLVPFSTAEVFTDRIANPAIELPIPERAINPPHPSLKSVQCAPNDPSGFGTYQASQRCLFLLLHAFVSNLPFSNRYRPNLCGSSIQSILYQSTKCICEFRQGDKVLARFKGSSRKEYPGEISETDNRREPTRLEPNISSGNP